MKDIIVTFILLPLALAIVQYFVFCLGYGKWLTIKEWWKLQ